MGCLCRRLKVGRWRSIGEGVVVEIAAGRLRVLHAGREVAAHDECRGWRQRALDPAHFAGVARLRAPVVAAGVSPPQAQLLRPLAAYEAAGGGSW